MSLAILARLDALELRVQALEGLIDVEKVAALNAAIADLKAMSEPRDSIKAVRPKVKATRA